MCGFPCGEKRWHRDRGAKAPAQRARSRASPVIDRFRASSRNGAAGAPPIGARQPTVVTTSLPITLRAAIRAIARSEEHTSELQSLMRISYAVFCLQKKKTERTVQHISNNQTHNPTYLPFKPTNR